LTKDVTLLKKSNKYSYYDHYVISNTADKAGELWVKLLHIDLPNNKLIYLLWQNTGSRLILIDLEQLEEFQAVISSVNKDKLNQNYLNELLEKFGIIHQMIGINSGTIDDDVLRSIARKIQATQSISNTNELL